jgi:hypothetical protein
MDMALIVTLPRRVGSFFYFDFFSCLAFFFSLMDFAGFFLSSFLASLDFAIVSSG